MRDKDIVPNMLNKRPTALWGLTQSELLRVFLKSSVISSIVLMIIGVFIAPLALITIFIGLGIIVGCSVAYFLCKNVIAPRKAGKPFGYHDHKAKLKSIWVKLGIVKLKTIHTSRLWRHFK